MPRGRWLSVDSTTSAGADTRNFASCCRGAAAPTAPADRLWHGREHHVDRHGQRGGQPRLNDHFGLAFLDELIARKVCGENASVEGLDWPFHEARLTELEAQLDRAFAESPLPEDRDRNAINDVLVGLRLARQ